MNLTIIFVVISIICACTSILLIFKDKALSDIFCIGTIVFIILGLLMLMEVI